MYLSLTQTNMYITSIIDKNEIIILTELKLISINKGFKKTKKPYVIIKFNFQHILFLLFI